MPFEDLMDTAELSPALKSSIGLKPATHLYQIGSILNIEDPDKIDVLQGLVDFAAKETDLINIRVRMFLTKDNRISSIVQRYSIQQVRSCSCQYLFCIGPTI